jgi:hypothetical protein
MSANQLERLLEVGDDLRYGRPVIPVQPQASRRRARHQLQRLELPRSRRRCRAPVEHVHQPPGLDARQRERRQGHGRHALAPLLPDRHDGWVPRQRLQHHDAEAVHVARRLHAPRAEILRVGVPARGGAGDGLHGLGLHAGGPPHGRAEAGQARRPGGVQEDAGGGDAAVDDERHGAAVQVVDGARRAQQRPDARLPGRRHRGRRGRRPAPVQVVAERAVARVGGDHDALPGLSAPAQEADDVVVAERREDGELRAEGVLGAAPPGLEALDGHLLPVAEPAPVHRPGVAVAEHDGEVVRGRRDLRQREFLIPFLQLGRLGVGARLRRLHPVEAAGNADVADDGEELEVGVDLPLEVPELLGLPGGHEDLVHAAPPLAGHDEVVRLLERVAQPGQQPRGLRVPEAREELGEHAGAAGKVLAVPAVLPGRPRRLADLGEEPEGVDADELRDARRVRQAAPHLLHDRLVASEPPSPAMRYTIHAMKPLPTVVRKSRSRCKLSRSAPSTTTRSSLMGPLAVAGPLRP